jgi:hypothetical protein
MLLNARLEQVAPLSVVAERRLIEATRCTGDKPYITVFHMFNYLYLIPTPYTHPYLSPTIQPTPPYLPHPFVAQIVVS